MADLTLYHNPVTVNSIKVLLLCNALDIKPTLKILQLHKGEQKADAFLAINSEGKVPALIDGKFVLTESNAILQYLAHKNQSDLWPVETRVQADVLKWLFWQSDNWNKAIGAIPHRRVVLPLWGVSINQEITQEQYAQYHRAMIGVEAALENRAVLAGDTISIADIGLASYLMFADEAELPMESYPNIKRWLNNLQKQPWWQQTRQTLTQISNQTHAYT